MAKIQVIVNLEVITHNPRNDKDGSLCLEEAACESILDAVLRGQDNGFNHSYPHTVESIRVENVGCPHKPIPVRSN